MIKERSEIFENYMLKYNHMLRKGLDKHDIKRGSEISDKFVGSEFSVSMFKGDRYYSILILDKIDG